MSQTASISALLRTFSGPLVWFIHLSLLYGGATMICRNGAGHSGFLVFALVVTAAALAILLGYCAMHLRIALAKQARRKADMFLNALGLMLAVLSLLAVTWTTAAALALGCGN